MIRIRIWLCLILGCVCPALVDAAEHDGRAALLLKLCDRLMTVQIDDPGSPDHGALLCPSTNPESHPLHSRAGEAVYPLAAAFRVTGHASYREAAIRLGDWLVSVQQFSGEWGERWPDHDGWTGTTVDQLISLAGAYPYLMDALQPAQRDAWLGAIRRSADYVQANWPRGNLNYWPTGAVALVYADLAVPSPPLAWRQKARELIAATLGSVNADGLLIGEGRGVDVGYNLAQTIGFLALYARLTGDQAVKREAARLLEHHLPFVYPNGAVDNSWGTRSYKWTLESGTKTAPGIYFTLALLADENPRLLEVESRARHFLEQHNMIDGWVAQGPHAGLRDSTNPPCLYGTFARAQSLAMAVMHAPRIAPAFEEEKDAGSEAEPPHVDFFPSIKVAVVRGHGMTATVSAYGEIAQVSRDFVARGGSITNLWFQDYGPTGFFQTSSVTDYRRQELIHMPREGELRPLTPRVELRRGGRLFTNLYETEAEMRVANDDGQAVVTVQGSLRDAAGVGCGVNYTLTHRFVAGTVIKEYHLNGAEQTDMARIVEPVVAAPGVVFAQPADDRVEIRLPAAGRWTLAVRDASVGFALSHGEDADRYWCPFPALTAHPIVINLTLAADGRADVTLALTAP